MATSLMMMTSLTHCPTVCMPVPEDILFEILIRLPVKSLLRFKSVRKSWYALIKSSNFIHRHRANMEDSNNPKLGTLVFEFDQTLAYSCCDFDMPVNRSCRRFQIVSGENSFNVYQNVGSIKNKRKRNVGSVPYFLAKSTEEGSTLAGSCHGVVCFYDLNIRDGIVLWNPATRQSKLLPKPLESKYDSGSYFVAFGFDAKTSDYKVLCVKFFVDEQDRYLNRDCFSSAQDDTTPEIQVYRQSTDSWRWIDSDFSCAKCCVLDWNKQGRYLNGNYFCIGLPRYFQTIVSFDFNKEVFSPVPNPGDCITFATEVFQLDSIGEKLACIKESNRFKEPNSLTAFEVWVLNDFNSVEERYSWTMLHKISTANEFDRWVPMGISRNRQFGFISEFKDTKLYNFTTGEIGDWDSGQGVQGKPCFNLIWFSAQLSLKIEF